MADNGRWFKLWCQSLDDPDLDSLDIADFGRWAKFGTYLKEHGNNGQIIIKFPARTLCAYLQIKDFDMLFLSLQKFPNCIVSHETVASVSLNVEWRNWHKYQGDISTSRVKKFRAKNAQNETLKKRREEKRKEEKRNTPIHTPIHTPSDNSLSVFQSIRLSDKDDFVFEIPDWIDKQTWQDYLEMRNKTKKPMTNKAKQLAVKKLDELCKNGNDPNEVLNQSILNSWQGLFPLKNKIEKRPERKILPL